jgi:hypothetical protein
MWEWEVSWSRRRADRYELSHPQTDPPGAVILTDPIAPIQPPTRLPGFSDALFPPTATATDALVVVVMDHAPQWSRSQEQAFVNWLHMGGKVCLTPDAVGSYPRFGGDLTALNGEAARQRIGAGVVVRHAVVGPKLTLEMLVELGLATVPSKEDISPQSNTEDHKYTLQVLKALTRAHHNWAALFTLSVLYLLLICPVTWLVGRRKDYRVTSLLFVACVLGFSLTFFMLGRRGYGENATINSLSYMRAASTGVYDLTQWSNIFVTSGDSYQVTHDSPYNLYSTTTSDERVRGVIRSGASGTFQVDMPLFSARGFVHRGQVEADPLISRVVTFKADTKLESLKLDVGAGFPDDPQGIWAVYREHAYSMRAHADGTLSLRGRGQSLETLVPDELKYGYGYYGFYALQGYDRSRDEDATMFRKRIFSSLAQAQIALRSGYVPEQSNFGARTPVAVVRPADAAKVTAPVDDTSNSHVVQFFVIAQTPDKLHVRGEQFGRQYGVTVYHQTLFDPEESASE